MDAFHWNDLVLADFFISSEWVFKWILVVWYVAIMLSSVGRLQVALKPGLFMTDFQIEFLARLVKLGRVDAEIGFCWVFDIRVESFILLFEQISLLLL